ncbi:MAG TPA: DUF2341 domain-containing protein [Candidatus Bathyarchaeia archaeon]|nr:DUF2341 domain-containing protein [Candidatus Bathyarchaeia archaeon]
MLKTSKKIFVLVVVIAIVSQSMIISQKNGSNSKSIDDYIDYPDQGTQDTQEPSNWFLGESVKTDIEFNKQLPDIENFDFWYSEHPITNIYMYDRFCMYETSGYLVQGFIFIYFESGNSNNFEMYFKIYCGGSGTLVWDYIPEFRDTSNNGDSLEREYGTYNIGLSNLDAQGFCDLLFSGAYNVGTNIISLSLSCYDGGNYYTSLDSGSSSIASSISDVAQIRLETDAFYFQKTTVENSIRSKYQYVSDSLIIHSLEIPSVQYAKEINIYAPETWTYNSINPSATVTSVSNDYTITSPTLLNYEILFTSSNLNLLALEDVSNDYFSSLGFEDGINDLYFYSNEWTEYIEGTFTISGVEFSKRKSCTVTNPVAETFSNMLVRIPVGYDSDMQSDFDDVLFTDTSSTVLDFALTEYVTSTTAQFYLEIPSFASSSDYNFYIYYGNPTITTMSDYTGTFIDNNVQLVMPLNSANDKSGNGLDFTNNGATFVAGRVGYGADLERDESDYLIRTKIEGNSPLGISGSYTVLSWVKMESSSSHNYLLHAEDTSVKYFFSNYISTQQGWTTFHGGSNQYTSSIGLYSAGTWFQQAISFTTSGDIITYYKNGASIDTDTQAITAWGDVNWRIGRDTATSVFFDGVIDELMIVKVCWSTNRINCFYQFQKIDDKAVWGTEEISLTESGHNNKFETYYQDYSIVSEGYSSLYLENSNTTAKLNFTLDVGYYYFSIDIFKESGTVNLTISHFNNAVQIDYECESLALNRWQKFYTTINITDPIANAINISVSDTFAGYVDNLKIWSVAGEISTIGYYKYNFYNQLVNLDGYQNNVISATSETVTIYNSTDIIFSDSATSNTAGECSFDFSAVLSADCYAINITTSTETVTYYFTPLQLNDTTIEFIEFDHYLIITSETGLNLYDIYADGSFIGSFVDYNTIPKIGTLGTHYFYICHYSNSTTSAFLPSVYLFQYTISSSLEIMLWNKDLDIASGLIFVNIKTNWANCSIRVFDNNTALGGYAAEGASIWSFDSSAYGLHNITISLYNGETLLLVEYFSFTIQEPSIVLYMVHFDLFTRFGVGLPFETAKIYVNDSRIYYPEQYYLAGSFLEIEARDYYNNLLYETTATITNNMDIALMLNLVGQHIKNKFAVAVEVYFFSTIDSNYNHSYILAAESEITLNMFCTSYNVLVIPLQKTFTNNTHIITYFTTASDYQDIDDKKTYEITMETDTRELTQETDYSIEGLKALAISSTMISVALATIIGAMVKFGFFRVWNLLVYLPNRFINWLCKKFGITWRAKLMLENKGGIEFITPEQVKLIDQKQKEGLM